MYLTHDIIQFGTNFPVEVQNYVSGWLKNESLKIEYLAELQALFSEMFNYHLLAAIRNSKGFRKIREYNTADITVFSTNEWFRLNLIDISDCA